MGAGSPRLIETDAFPIEFVSELAERESWRKEIHRPIYHVHKWWAKRLGSVFRGILLGSSVGADRKLEDEFYRTQSFKSISVLDPFMGSGTTIGEAHKLGFTALGRDINPVAVAAVRVALGRLNRDSIEAAFSTLSESVGKEILRLYRSTDSEGRPCEVLYYFWVMRATCPGCRNGVDLFSSYVIAKNVDPNRKPALQVLCPACGHIFVGSYGRERETCPACQHPFDPRHGTAKGRSGRCSHCRGAFLIREAVAKSGGRPGFRLYGKLVLKENGKKEYLRASPEDLSEYETCSNVLQADVLSGAINLPALTLEAGHNTRQAMSYGFSAWKDIFNDRQLLALGRLNAAISRISDDATRAALSMLFSGTLEFNNLYASYKGEGTGAVRHMFSHHILKPERMPIEANVWGASRSSGSFAGLFRSRLLRAIDYRETPTEVNRRGSSERQAVCSEPFSGSVLDWPSDVAMTPRGIYLSCGDSAATDLPDRSIDLVVTDPPFFDNVHYSELAEFFYAWYQSGKSMQARSTRRDGEVQDGDADRFARKLKGVFRECNRLLQDDGLLVFTYHHSRHEGWRSVVEAVLGAGFSFVNAQPVKSEMSAATPKAAAREPIQLDAILVCRKTVDGRKVATVDEALASARDKLMRLQSAGLKLSRNDRLVAIYGQMLTTLRSSADMEQVSEWVEDELLEMDGYAVRRLRRRA